MGKRYVEDTQPSDFDVLKAIRFCWERGIYFYPVIISGTGSGYKYPPKCRIELKQNGITKLGEEEYNQVSQADEMYDKIRQLYLHRQSQILLKTK